MADQEIDVHGLNCPEPVIRVQAALKGIDAGTVRVLASTLTTCDNLRRLCRRLKAEIASESEASGDNLIEFTKG